MESLVDLLKHYPSFSHVVPFDPAKDKLLSIDFTAANNELTEDILNDLIKFNDYMIMKKFTSRAKYCIGGYAEHRTIYSRSRLFDAPGKTDEPRRLHLGVDIWGPASTPVIAPLDGMVHSFADNTAAGDYGPTIILYHYVDGIEFYTLYGHLSLDSLKYKIGDLIWKGDQFAAFGFPGENGQWPCHLHFQIIKDLGNYKGDYPGVCKYSEKESYLQNCPDPELILRMQSSQ